MTMFNIGLSSVWLSFMKLIVTLQCQNFSPAGGVLGSGELGTWRVVESLTLRMPFYFIKPGYD